MALTTYFSALRTLSALLVLGTATLSAVAEEPATPQFFPADFALAEGQTAVVELFTSEGCSSCPPADKVVAQIAQQAKSANIPLVVLAWHVDCWDKLKTHHGVWKDPYSSAEHTAYQTWYLKTHRDTGATTSGNLFTPQIVIGGARLDRRTPLSQSIKQNSTDPAAPTLDAQVSRTDDSIAVGPSFSQPFEVPVRLTIALLQDGIVTEITAGENYGKTLAHDNVVRSSMSQVVPAGKTPTAVDLAT